METIIMVFLARKFEKGGSKSSVQQAQAALVWFFKLTGAQPNLAQAALLRMIAESSKRKACPTVHQAKASQDDVKKLFDIFWEKDTKMEDKRAAILFIVMFSACLRISEALASDCTDVSR
uniref:Uncharacterized protein n=1 Tax=Plectus sambesii TaxID=2011161 RepID=A0A914UZY6_9BILA